MRLLETACVVWNTDSVSFTTTVLLLSEAVLTPVTSKTQSWGFCREIWFTWNEKTLTPWKESYDQPRQHNKKQRYYLPTTVCLVKVMVFLVVMYGCEIWTIKKAEHQRIDSLELWCWRRLLRAPWSARSSNQLILKAISVLGVHWKD